MELTIAFLKTIPSLIQSNKKGIFNVLTVVIVTVLLNINEIRKLFGSKDIVVAYAAMSTQVERSLKVYQNTYNFDAVNIGVLHNGVVSIADPEFHLMKFSILFATGHNARSNKALYINQPLSVWLDNINAMIHEGYFVIESAPDSEDPLVRELYKSHKMSTQVYLPIFKDGLLIAFAISSYKNKTEVTPALVNQMKRSLQVIEARL